MPARPCRPPISHGASSLDLRSSILVFLRGLSESRCDGIRHLVRGSPDRVSLEMGIARRRLHLSMPQQLADHRQILAELQRVGGEGMTQIVDAEIIQPGLLAQPAPGLLHIG